MSLKIESPGAAAPPAATFAERAFHLLHADILSAYPC
jgi:hypothetical protein